MQVNNAPHRRPTAIGYKTKALQWPIEKSNGRESWPSRSLIARRGLRNVEIWREWICGTFSEDRGITHCSLRVTIDVWSACERCPAAAATIRLSRPIAVYTISCTLPSILDAKCPVHVCAYRLAYLKNHKYELHRIFYARRLWPWLLYVFPPSTPLVFPFFTWCHFSDI